MRTNERTWRIAARAYASGMSSWRKLTLRLGEKVAAERCQEKATDLQNLIGGDAAVEPWMCDWSLELCAA